MKMAVEKVDQTVFEGDGGGYYIRSNSETPFYAGKLLLRPLGFAPPHYGDSNKICLVLEGTITVGLVAPNSTEEKVFLINKGDVVPVSAGMVSWWFNGGDTNAVLILMAETSKALVPGQLSYFLMAGVQGILAGFQSNFVGKIFGLDQKESEKIVNSQQGSLIFKLDHGIKFPEPNDHLEHKLYASIDDPSSKVKVNSGGTITSLTEKNFPMLGMIGLSARFVKLEGNAVLAPSYVADGSVQICYVGKGSGRIKVVDNEGKLAFDTKVGEGDLFIVPQFFPTAQIADDCGMEVFSVITSSKPVFGQLAGNTSVWSALSPVVLQASLNITPETEQLFKSKNSKSITIVPPST
ncbi:putative 11-S seed storage protein, plant [Helianthus annuus]|uniref:11-S seed storage protein, plant n=1 Tax=Helianthus annuus TaxID=4232 RepID=A0A251SHB9_HELAN|nr:glutelin type-D 1 [Helianthus annuus]KAF5789623.1 putative 11-S seed storage protein, plant [Helianthus annuus]KAJ0524987.1 putative 11-S seed storage protein, plant [Helianthus annuus]KAJ0532968.1 putative 11-S seed storage protein, plant [Helianthus annuus]KAJ0541349.1 putative 11-S seed storage protein, plant [Helianthus annuus]KAJ0706428.1 putative 11-S seed storage protein, plant [Helianthus annuus]